MRPADLEFPRVFYNFKAKAKESDEIIEYEVQDLPEELYEDALELLVRDFLPDEIVCTSKGLHKQGSSLNELLEFIRAVLKKRLSIACFRKGDAKELVAVNFLGMSEKDDDFDITTFKSQSIRELFMKAEFITEKAMIFDKYQVDKYISGFGLIVDKKYRGRGIATEMLKARKPLLEALNMKVTATVFSMIDSQKAALNAGYVEDYALRYDELVNIKPEFQVEIGETEFYKILTLKI